MNTLRCQEKPEKRGSRRAVLRGGFPEQARKANQANLKRGGVVNTPSAEPLRVRSQSEKAAQMIARGQNHAGSGLGFSLCAQAGSLRSTTAR
jgi:hypothetical protein